MRIKSVILSFIIILLGVSTYLTYPDINSLEEKMNYVDFGWYYAVLTGFYSILGRLGTLIFTLLIAILIIFFSVKKDK